jgi:hypothetical protein
MRSFAEANKIPNILHEIGRLREILPGKWEGTNEGLLIWTNLTNTTTIFFYGMRMHRKLLELPRWDWV